MSVQLLHLEPLTVSELQEQIVHRIGLSLAIPLDETTIDPFVDEVIRGAVWALNRDGLGAHSNAVGNRVYAILRSGILNEITRRNGDTELAKASLSRLRLLGDVTQGKGGRWRPAPMRLIDTGVEHALLHGGYPAHLLPGALRALLVTEGGGRWLKGPRTFLEPKLPGVPWQSFHGWLGLPHITLAEHFDRWFRTSRTSSTEPADAGKFEVYAPQHSHSQRAQGSQNQRWIEVSDNQVSNGKYLVRFQPKNSSFAYGIANIASGRVTAMSDLFLEKDEALRLRFAIDAQVCHPLIIKQISPVRVRLGCSLPHAETRLLTACAQKLPQHDDWNFPQVWQFESDHGWQLWKSVIEELGVQITDDMATASSHEG